MRKIIILGAGIAGRNLAERLKSKGEDIEITVIDRFAKYFSKKNTIVKPNSFDGCVRIDEWADDCGVEFLNDKVERINLKRKKINFSQIESRDFSELIIATGLKSKKIPIKGEHRDGFFYLSQIDPPRLRDALKISEEVTVSISTWLGLRFAVSLASLGKEVRVVVSNMNFLGELREPVVGLLQRGGISLYLDSAVEEAVGNGTVKAVKISPFKIFSSQAVFVDSGFIANMDFFEESITSRDSFFTDFEGVYLLGDVADREVGDEKFFVFNQENVRKQASAFADFITEGKALACDKKMATFEDLKVDVDNILKEGKLWQSGLV